MSESLESEIKFPLTKYERGIFVECSCKSIEELPLDESQPIRITGRPKNIAEGNCSQCKKRIIVYASIWIGD
ncbi:MAG: hypothetical protein WC623_22305 [Pedobacter sp.]|uniref:hypothetical protein n=1 Tax=Pedobacter sp. TaxID=1411316 RepID=UPI00356468D1